MSFIETNLQAAGLSPNMIAWIFDGLWIAGLIVLAWISNFVAKKNHSSSNFSDY